MTIFLFYLLGAVCAIMVLVQGFSRKVELFSVRNLYLAGFVVYHVVGPAKALSTGHFFGFRVVSPEATGRVLLLYVWVYFLVYLFSYHRIKIVRWFAAKLSAIPSEGADSMLMMMAIGLVAVGLPMRLFGHQIPVVGNVLVNISLAMAAMACALSGWVWSQRKFNMVVLSFTLAILAGSIAISVFAIFGRRPLIGVLFGFAWGAYYRWARFVAPGKLILYMIPLMAAATLVVSAFTAVRGQTSKGYTTDVRSVLRAMTQADVKKGSESVVSGQACSGAMLWAIEQYPRHIKPKPLFSLRYMAMFFVPRQLWANKPTPLSTEIADLAKLHGVRRDKITLPPAVVGYAAAEGGFYALILYALFFGQFTRFSDEVVRQNPLNPFIVLPCGCVTGQFLGLARGDIGSFTAIIIISFVATMAVMFMAKLVFGRRAASGYAMQWSPPG
ncbi:MAG: hypothetical protein ACR2NM_15120 [Bythopirellula sp.]